MTAIKSPLDRRGAARKLYAMSDQTDKVQTPYNLVGGDDGVRSLVAEFYRLMDTLPEVKTIRDMHKGDLRRNDRKAFGVPDRLDGRSAKVQ